MIRGRPTKELTKKEKDFARLLFEGNTIREASYKVWGWHGSTKSNTYLRAKSIAQSKRVKDYVAKLDNKDAITALMSNDIEETQPSDWDNIQSYAIHQLKQIRDDPKKGAKTRWEALQAIEKLADPSQDMNLIWKYIEIAWMGLTAHCPCCHKSFPLAAIRNKSLNDHLAFENKKPVDSPIENELQRRLYLLDLADKMRTPRHHPAQMRAISAPERHIIGSGSARVGKSYTLALLGLLYLMIPGSNVWLLAQTYSSAEHEFNYLEAMFYTMFYPLQKHMYEIRFDKKLGEGYITTKWGSEIAIKSSKSKGSITGKELDCILVAEPGWVDADIFEEVRARMSSRLGRIFALGTPKGYGNFLGRMMRLTTREMGSGKRIAPGSRLIENGSPWSESILYYQFQPKDNPEYVQSELEAAKKELTEAEYASEFEGIIIPDHGKKFPFISERDIRKPNYSDLEKVGVILGIDQGESNFAYTIVGWDGITAYVLQEYLDADKSNTIRNNLLMLHKTFYDELMKFRISREAWRLTIFDADPPVHGQLVSLEAEGKKWPVDVTYRPKAQKEFQNWREETYSFVNELSKAGRLIFSPDCELLHDNLSDVLSIPEQPGVESTPSKRKGWIVPSARYEHVLDAFMLAMWPIYQGMVEPLKFAEQKKGTIYDQIEQQRQYLMKVQEMRELQGFGNKTTSSDVYREVFGSEPPSRRVFRGPRNYHYSDA